MATPLEHAFVEPMQPWPDLEQAVHYLQLPGADLRLFTYQAGSHPQLTLLLVHGLGDEADSWRHVLLPLSQRARVIAIDLPGFGRSAKPDIAYTLPFYCRTIQSLVQALDLQQVVLVGSSMGAAICQSLALEEPAWLKGLVLVDGALLTAGQRLNLGLLLFLIPGLGEWLYNRLRKDPQAAYQTLRPYYASLEQLPQADRDFLYRRVNQRVWDDAQRRAYFSALRSLAAYISGQQKGLSGRLRQLQLPALALWGAQDQIIPLATGQALAQAQPSARLVIFPNSGHLPHQEHPQEFIESVSSFIDQLRNTSLAEVQP
jgi:pimeloyl-ACP methyl ester carboxylesterase